MEKEEMAKMVEKKKTWRHWYLLSSTLTVLLFWDQASQTRTTGRLWTAKINLRTKRRRGPECNKEVWEKVALKTKDIKTKTDNRKKGERISAAAVVWVSHWHHFLMGKFVLILIAYLTWCKTSDTRTKILHIIIPVNAYNVCMWAQCTTLDTVK